MEKNNRNKKNKMHLFKFLCQYYIYMNKNEYKYYFEKYRSLDEFFAKLEFFKILEGMYE